MVVDAAAKRQGHSPAPAGDYRRRYTGVCSCVPSSSLSPCLVFWELRRCCLGMLTYTVLTIEVLYKQAAAHGP